MHARRLASIGLLVIPSSAAAAPGSLTASAGPGRAVLEAGESWADAPLIPGLPFGIQESTCGHTHDIELHCTDTGAAPDVVFRLVAPASGALTVDLCCGFDYDTAVGVFDSAHVELACDDNGCGTQSRVHGLHVIEGRSYYVVVSGAGGACGTYSMGIWMEAMASCVHPAACGPCPSGAVDEHEPVCHDEYYDRTNGGCNSTGWTELCPERGGTASACGTSGTFYNRGYPFRDTDWYRAVSAGGEVRMTVAAEFQPLLILLYSEDGRISCSRFSYIYQFGSSCQSGGVSLCGYVGPQGSECWPWVGPQVFGEGVPCGVRYVLTVEGLECGATATCPTRWGEVKSLFR